MTWREVLFCQPWSGSKHRYSTVFCLQVAGVCDSADGSTEFLKDSVPSLAKDKDDDMKEFQRELINLPTFEIDTHRMDEATMPLVSRSNSVPEKLGHLHINCNGTRHSRVISFLLLSVSRVILYCLFHPCHDDTLKKS